MQKIKIWSVLLSNPERLRIFTSKMHNPSEDSLPANQAGSELAGELATGNLAVSDAYVMQGDTLCEHLETLSPNSPIRDAYNYWLSLSNNGRVPTRQSIDPTAISVETVPHIVLIDVEYGPEQRFRYRLVGTGVTRIFGADYTGNYLDEMDQGQVFGRIQAFYSLVCKDQQPSMLYGSYLAKSGIAFDVARLVMPLSDDGNRVDALFCIVERT